MSLERAIRRQPARANAVDTGTLDDVKTWLEARAGEHGLCWLLAHTDEGVVWGRLDDGRLVTSHDAAQGCAEAEACSPPLRDELLQQARLFAEHAELLLWRDGDDSWQARLIQDVPADEASWDEAIDEHLMLVGRPAIHLPHHGFTLLRDGGQGLRHAMPLKLPLELDEKALPRLIVRHYLNREAFACIVVSRLVGLQWAQAGEERG